MPVTEISMSMDGRWILAIESGDKTATTRIERKGAVGDTFNLNGRVYAITRVLPLPFWDAVHSFYRTEGFRSESEFRSVMKGYYPDLKDDSTVFIHFFEEVRV